MPHATPAFRRLAGTALLALAAVGCETVERLPDTPAPARVTRSSVDVPRIMRGTVGADTTMIGYQPVVVRGYGLVVGLDGTGCTSMPPELRAHMLQDMRRRGVGMQQQGMGGIDPDRMLDARDTAVVIVEGVLPPGAVGRYERRGVRLPGSQFDVRVFLDPRTDATSLDGGRLYTCELRPIAPGTVLPPTGSQQARVLAEARGEVFVNPFADPQEVGPEGRPMDTIDRTRGRILRGGEAAIDNPLKLQLLNPSHARADAISRAINARFPREPGQPEETARGVSGEIIDIHVPRSYRARTTDFISLLRHLTIRQFGAESIAASVRRIVVQDPGYAEAGGWRWEALGTKSLPIIRDLYDVPEEAPRMAALRAGARLDDALAIPPLIEMSRADSVDTRLRAIDLLSICRPDLRIDARLAELLDDGDRAVRLAAYEGLMTRDAAQVVSYSVDDEWRIDVVESDYPMVYVAQRGVPRIVIFGRDAAVDHPLLVDMWDGNLILRTSEETPGRVRVFFRPGDGLEFLDHEVGSTLLELALFFAHRTTVEAPEIGLGLSFAETIGALYQVKAQGGLAADFMAEQDRVQEALARLFDEDAQNTGARPEFAEGPAATGGGRDADGDGFLDPLPARDADESASDARRLSEPPPLEGDDGG